MLTKVKLLGAVALFLVAASAWQVFGPGFGTTEKAPQRRVVEMLVEFSDVDGKAGNGFVTAFTVSDLGGRMDWRPSRAAVVSHTWAETMSINPHESLRVYLTATPGAPSSFRRSVTCSVRVNGKHIPRSPSRSISYVGDPPRACLLDYVIPALIK